MPIALRLSPLLSAMGVALLLGLAEGRGLAQDMRAGDMRPAGDMRAGDMRAGDMAPAADLSEVPDQLAQVDAAAPPDLAPAVDAQGPGPGPGNDLAAPQEPLQFRGGGVSCAMTLSSGPAPAGAGLFLLGLCLVLRRGRRRRTGRGAAGAALLAPLIFFISISGGEARAQAVDAIHFRPTGMPHGMINVEGSATQPQGSVAATAYFSYATQPLLLVSGATGMLPEMGRAGVLSQALMNVAVTVGLGDMLALGLDVPVMLYQDLGDLATQRRIRGESMSMGGASQSLGGAAATDPLASPQAAGVGDLRLLLKMRLVDNTLRGLGFALVPMVTVPSGDGSSYLGWGKAAFEGRAVLDYRFGNGVLLSANAALYVRENTRFLNLNLGNEFRYGGGMYWPVSDRLSLLAEIFGRVGWTGPSDETSATSEAAPAEGLVGVRYRHDQGVTVQAGAGLGLGHGYGAPSSRVFLSFGYTPALGEGQVQKAALEPAQGPAQGAKAPVQAPVLGGGGKGDKEALAAAAPAKADRDGDGVSDEMDRCPERAGLRENMGCPDRDEDGDGVVDRLDQCPSVAGTREAAGCPIREGISPAQGGAQGGAQTQDGAQGQGPAQAQSMTPGAAQAPAAGELAQLRGWRFEMREPIAFTLGTATFTGRSEEVLREVAQVLKARPEIRLLRIEGHVDEPNNSGPRARALSRERAEAVKRKLVELGVPASKLETQGYGYSRLLDRSETPEARLRNNRIEIVVLD